MKLLKEILTEARSVKGGVDIGGNFRVMRIGFDKNGNWSYWVSVGGRARKIQATNLMGGKHKVTNINDFRTDATDQEKENIKQYYNEYMA